MAFLHVVRVVSLVAAAGMVPLGLPAQQPAADPPTPWDAAVAVRVASTGYGVEVSKLLTGHLGARVGANFGSWHTTRVDTDVRFDVSIKASSAAFLLDLFPSSRGSFHFTGGWHTRPLKVTGTGVPAAGTVTFNGRAYPASQVGSVAARVDLPGGAPYLGLGFGTPASRGSSIRLRLDLGALLMQPDLVVAATGAAAYPQLQADLAAEQARVQRDIDRYAKFYPVLSLGIAYKR